MTNNTVTIWHNGVPEIYRNVYTNIKDGLNKNGIKQKGFFESRVCTLRIPTVSKLTVSIGDYVREGEHSGAYDRNFDFKIMKLSENLLGSNPHYKVVCER